MASHSLPNPLIENEPAPSTAVQYSHPRFDYYTDPVSAFSADKRRNNFLHQVSQGYSSVPPNMTSSPGQRPTHVPGGHHIQSSSLGVPMGAAGPLGPQGNTSNTWGGSYSSLNYNYPPHMGDFNFPNSVVGLGDSPHAFHGWGRGRYSNSPHPQLYSRHDSRHGSGHYSDWGRGRGPSLSLGPSARRGKDSQNPVSAELRPDLHYNKEMLEDPWKGMTPVIWKGPNGSWLPKLLA